MDFFNYQQGTLYAEDVPVATIAKQYGTPCYIYSRAMLERHWHAFDSALGDYPHLICYAVKANSNLAVLQVLARLGSGFDIVSLGELERVRAAGGQSNRIVFSGVAKLAHEIAKALEYGIFCFNVESAAELDAINQIAQQLGKIAPIALRINPDIDAKTHPYISTGLKQNKFGVALAQALPLYIRAASLPAVQPIGIACHLGSQITELQPFLAALDKVLVLQQQLQAHGIALSHIDLGGGLGIPYHHETPPLPSEYAAVLLAKLRDYGLTLVLEPGRAIAGNSGILLTQVIYEKQNEENNFLIVDAGMNDLLRPALYQAWHDVVPVHPDPGCPERIVNVVGPVCETSDFFAKDRRLAAKTGDLLAIRSAGAYGFSMSSQYNSRPRAAEVLVTGDTTHLVRSRELITDLFVGEHLIADHDG